MRSGAEGEHRTGEDDGRSLTLDSTGSIQPIARGRSRAPPAVPAPQPVRQVRTRDATEGVAQAARGVFIALLHSFVVTRMYPLPSRSAHSLKSTLVDRIIKFSKFNKSRAHKVIRMDIFGTKAQNLLGQAQDLLNRAHEEMAKDIEALKGKQALTDERLAKMEAKQDEAAEKIGKLQESLDEIRDSAIRGEVASGQKTKDVAHKFGLSSARVSQIAPRRRYNNG